MVSVGWPVVSVGWHSAIVGWLLVFMVGVWVCSLALPDFCWFPFAIRVLVFGLVGSSRGEASVRER